LREKLLIPGDILVTEMGRVWKFSDNVNTDVIIPARYNITTEEKELARNVFCEIRPEISKQAKEGDIIIAGNNFGCGSSREHAAIAIKGLNVKCVVAKSYSRIFFRNSINIGLPVLECYDTDKIEDGDLLDIDLKEGTIMNKTSGKNYRAKPLPEFVLKIVNEGGIVNFLKNHDIGELK
jgi:3-isopropylmalate/(R)-2-methylmalate dehydratase small subunit